MKSNSFRAPPSTPRGIALTLLGRIEDEGAFADRILAADPVASLPDRDRQFVRELVLGALRWRSRLDHVVVTFAGRPLAKIDPPVRDVLRLGLYQFMFMNSVPDFAAVDESVRLARTVRGTGASGLVNALLRRFQREGEPPPPDGDVDRIAVTCAHPRWLVERWTGHFGVEITEAICHAGVEKHPIFVRARRGRITAAELAERLVDKGFDPSPVPGFPDYLALAKATGLFGSEPFTTGLCTVQDPAAGMAVDLLDPQPGEHILDCCAAPGGKTTRIAELMEDRGKVTAIDVHEGRLGLVRGVAERLGLKSIVCIAGDVLEFADAPKNGYDRVLVDAPCTGTGVLAKRPDMKWRLMPEDIPRMAALQAVMLGHMSGLVRPGGVLVYSTCTLEPEENEEVVSSFLGAHEDFSLETAEVFGDVSSGAATNAGNLVLPHEGGGTGAYAAKLIRKES